MSREDARLEDGEESAVHEKPGGRTDQARPIEPRLVPDIGKGELRQRDGDRDAEDGVVRNDERRPDPVDARPVAVEAEEVQAGVALVEQRLEHRPLLQDPVGQAQPQHPLRGKPASSHEFAHEERASAVEAHDAQQAEGQAAQGYRAEEHLAHERREDEQHERWLPTSHGRASSSSR
jgi:hypothetical protein